MVAKWSKRQAEQQGLFAIEPEDTGLTSSDKEAAAFSDPAFAHNKTLPIHR